jgi:hypothetical protein
VWHKKEMFMNSKVIMAVFLLLGGVYGAWSFKAMYAMQVMQENVDTMQQAWASNHDGVFSLTYDTMDVGGFPRSPVVSLSKPCLTFISSDKLQKTLCTKKLKIASVGYGVNEFSVQLPMRGQARLGSQGAMKIVEIAADDAPVVRLQQVEPQKDSNGVIKNDDVLREWMMRYPSTLSLHVGVGKDTKEMDFQFVAMPATSWQPVNYNAHQMFDRFFSVLNDVQQRGKSSAPILPE